MFTEKIRQAFRQLRECNEQLQTVQQQQKELMDTLLLMQDANAAAFSELKERIIHAENKIDGITDRAVSIENKIDGITDRAVSIENKIDGVTNRAVSIENKIDGVTNRAISIEGRTDELIVRAKSIEGKENDIAEKWKKTGNVRIKLKGLN
ncbi:hypothetical protein [Oscillibacter ruminantium]|uniref:hypothetical protein n=1 Tax=Oscillibacter ruminantium TaxID=1263547 RepID=UPI00031C8FCB|nr:hypothetical protein [Oscillibacter ruminantium]